MSWLFYALLSPAFFAVGAIFDKFMISKKIKDPLVMLAASRIMIIPLPFIIFWLNGFEWIGITQFLILFIGGILGTAYLVPYFKSLIKEDASTVIPLFGLIPVFSLVLSYLILKENLSTIQLTGFALILFGAFALSVEKFEGKIFKPRTVLWLMALSSFIYSFTVVMFKYVVVLNNFWLSYSYMLMGEIFGALMFFFFSPKLLSSLIKLPKSSYILAVLSYSTALFGRFTAFYALLFVPVAIVMDISGLQPVFVLILAIVVSKWLPGIVKEDLSVKTIIYKSAVLIPIVIGGILVNM